MIVSKKIKKQSHMTKISFGLLSSPADDCIRNENIENHGSSTCLMQRLTFDPATVLPSAMFVV